MHPTEAESGVGLERRLENQMTNWIGTRSGSVSAFRFPCCSSAGLCSGGAVKLNCSMMRMETNRRSSVWESFLAAGKFREILCEEFLWSLPPPGTSFAGVEFAFAICHWGTLLGTLARNLGCIIFHSNKLDPFCFWKKTGKFRFGSIVEFVDLLFVFAGTGYLLAARTPRQSAVPRGFAWIECNWNLLDVGALKTSAGPFVGVLGNLLQVSLVARAVAIQESWPTLQRNLQDLIRTPSPCWA